MTVNMDNACDDHSPPLSENAGGSWLHWENEISSISGLNLDSTSELNGLVEDKEVAARAVALVVNSTRKGIVPLCADIASLLRAKRSLEKKVYLLKREVEALRSSTSVSFRTSHSTSPTPPLIEKTGLMDHHVSNNGQDRSRPCSRCSQCSVSGSHNIKHHLSSPTVSRPASTRTSPRLSRSQASKIPVVNGGVTSNFVETATPSLNEVGPSLPPHRHVSSQHAKRKNSLPEMTCEPSTEVPRINPKISKEIQCSIPLLGESPLEEQFLETVRLNSKLSEELGSARKEIEFLKGRLKELEMKQLARECSSHKGCHFESNTGDIYLTTEPINHGFNMYRHLNNRHQRPKSNGLSKSYSSHRVSAPPGSLLYAEPLYGCKCTACEEAMGSDIHSALSAALNEELQKFPISSNVLVQLGDHVVTKGEKTGRIRYIGHLDKIGQPNMVFVGLELDAPVGHHDGFFNNKRYFFCQKDHGIFVPLHDMLCKVSAKASFGRWSLIDIIVGGKEDKDAGRVAVYDVQGADKDEICMAKNVNGVGLEDAHPEIDSFINEIQIHSSPSDLDGRVEGGVELSTAQTHTKNISSKGNTIEDYV